MNKTPSASRLHIAVFGRRNAGKSSVVNAIVDQPVAIVSEVPGTTTDPVFKSIEIHSVGPCMVVDTAGLDDFGTVGELRMARSMQILDRTHLALVIVDAAVGADELEMDLLTLLRERNIQPLVVVNKIDLLIGRSAGSVSSGKAKLTAAGAESAAVLNFMSPAPADGKTTPGPEKRGATLPPASVDGKTIPSREKRGATLPPAPADGKTIPGPEKRGATLPPAPVDGKQFITAVPAPQLATLAEMFAPVLGVSALQGINIAALKKAIADFAPIREEEATPLTGLVSPGDIVVLVVPIDVEAPKGRLILPQVQTLRDVLDKDAFSVVVKADRLRDALASLQKKPVLVVTDSQAFAEVARDTPPDIPMTSFSILYARLKGDFEAAIAGVQKIDELQDGDTVLIAEACTHHPIEDDIARIKIPKLLKRKTGKDLKIRYATGHDFASTEDIKLIIHCGSCMLTRRETLSRYNAAASKKIPITNYGVAIAHLLGILPRALAPFRMRGLLGAAEPRPEESNA